MRKGIIFCILTIAVAIGVQHKLFAQLWSVSTIPAELKLKANAVVRNHEVTLSVNDKGEAEEFVSFAITILNEKGSRYNQMVEFYNKYSSVSGIKGTIYDKNGKKVKSIPSNEIRDYSAIQGFSLYEDNRVKAITPDFGDYPYTVEYSYSKKNKSFFVLPGWHVYPGYNISIQSSTYSLVLSPKAKVKFAGNAAFNIIPSEGRDKEGNIIRRRWEAKNLPAIENEPFSAYLHEETPVLMVAPESFTMDGYFGSNNSWKELGDWAYRLGEGRDVVPQATKDKVIALVADAETDYEKAKRIYEFMQNKVRYVNISVGIGGWQPFPAETVENFSYGDCKALTNYMKTLLDVVGIKSNYCLVKAGEDVPNINPNFVCSQFNHAFLMIPFGADTVFLECTSQQSPFAYNGTFTDDRHILVIEKDGSYLKRTNVYGKDKNRIIGNYNFKLSETNEAKLIVSNTFVGVASEEADYYKSLKPERQREIALRRLQLRQAKINSLSYTSHKKQVPVVVENIDLNIAQLGQVTASKTIVIPFNQVSQLDDIKRVSNRKTAMEIRRDQQLIDTIRFELPKRFTFEQLPQPAKVESEFGSYNLEVVVGKNEVSFIRTLDWKRGNYQTEKYDDLFQFHRRVSDFDRQVLILKPI
jgi:hypothetical protein